MNRMMLRYGDRRRIGRARREGIRLPVTPRPERPRPQPARCVPWARWRRDGGGTQAGGRGSRQIHPGLAGLPVGQAGQRDDEGAGGVAYARRHGEPGCLLCSGQVTITPVRRACRGAGGFAPRGRRDPAWQRPLVPIQSTQRIDHEWHSAAPDVSPFLRDAVQPAHALHESDIARACSGLPVRADVDFRDLCREGEGGNSRMLSYQDLVVAYSGGGPASRAWNQR